MSSHDTAPPPPVTDTGVATDETAEEAVRQVVANGRLESAPDPDAEELDEMLAVARGQRRAEDIIASIGRRYG